jgi:hypothetical protein
MKLKTTRKQRNKIYKTLINELEKPYQQFICVILQWKLKIDHDLYNYPGLFLIVEESIKGGTIRVDEKVIDEQYILIKQICLDLAQLID